MAMCFFNQKAVESARPCKAGTNMEEFLMRTLRWLLLGIGLLAAAMGAAATQTTTYFHNDGSGSPHLATDAGGQLLWHESYLPYGGKLNNQPASQGNSIGFHGKSFDNHTGLSYMTARYYDPVLGRFTGVDPEGFDPEDVHSFNRYAYAKNNPAKYVDPDGRVPVLLLAVPVVLKAVDLTLTAIDLYMAAQTGGTSALAKAVAVNAVTSVSPIPGSKIAAKVANRVGDAAGATKVTAGELRKAGRSDFNASRSEALAANGGKCTYCDKSATAGDHVKSLKSYADDVNAGKISRSDAIKQANSRENIAGACTSCNSSKGARELSAAEGPGKWVAPNGFYRD